MADANIVVLDAVKGVYRHVATGFTVHEIYSISDAVQCNGVLAYDSEGKWAWVAGRDLRVEITKLGAGGSLSSLASCILRSYKFGASMVHGHVYAADGNARRMIDLPSMMFVPRSAVGLRIFGVINNAAAGRGCAQSLMSAYEANSDPVRVFLQGWSGMPMYAADSNDGSNIQSIEAGTVPVAYATVIGRVLITIPMSTWEDFLAAWAANIPNKDQSEVQEKISGALAAVTAEKLKTQFGVVPTVLAPFVLYSDGTAMLEANVKPSVYTVSGVTYNHRVIWNLFATPSLPETQYGWWHTNPTAVPVAGTNVPSAYSKAGASILGVDEITGTYATGVWKFTPENTPVGSIDGVPLFNILGGLYPRAAAVGAQAVTTPQLLATAFDHAYIDEAITPQTGGQTSDAYATQVATQLENGVSKTEMTLPSSWAFAGQPAFAASAMLAMYIQGTPKITGLTMALNLSGHYMPSARWTKGTTVTRAVNQRRFLIADVLNYVLQ